MSIYSTIENESLEATLESAERAEAPTLPAPALTSLAISQALAAADGNAVDEYYLALGRLIEEGVVELVDGYLRLVRVDA